MILYTSGTTGRPKGVLHTHNSIHALIRQLGEHWRVDPGDTFLVPSPIAHIGGSIYAFEMPLLLGTTAVLMETLERRRRGRADARRTAAPTWRARRRSCSSCWRPPRRAGTRLPDLKVFICGGASVPPSLIRRATGVLRARRGHAGSTDPPRCP